jgi:hypothetical protein
MSPVAQEGEGIKRERELERRGKLKNGKGKSDAGKKTDSSH